MAIHAGDHLVDLDHAVRGVVGDRLREHGLRGHQLAHQIDQAVDLVHGDADGRRLVTVARATAGRLPRCLDGRLDRGRGDEAGLVGRPRGVREHLPRARASQERVDGGPHSLEGLRRRVGCVGCGGDLAEELAQDVRGGEESVDHLGGDGKTAHADLLEEALENVGEAGDLREAHHGAAALETVGEAEDHVDRVGSVGRLLQPEHARLELRQLLGGLFDEKAAELLVQGPGLRVRRLTWRSRGRPARRRPGPCRRREARGACRRCGRGRSRIRSPRARPPGRAPPGSPRRPGSRRR